MKDGKTDYVAGVCNIDSVGVRYRKRIALVTALIGVAILALMFYFRVDPLIRFITATGFAAGAALNSIQASEKFCVTNALAGTSEQNLRRSKLDRSNEQTEQDRKKTMMIVIKAVITALAAGTFALLPV